jgi:hypothetical protein
MKGQEARKRSEEERQRKERGREKEERGTEEQRNRGRDEERKRGREIRKGGHLQFFFLSDWKRNRRLVRSSERSLFRPIHQLRGCRLC